MSYKSEPKISEKDTANFHLPLVASLNFCGFQGPDPPQRQKPEIQMHCLRECSATTSIKKTLNHTGGNQGKRC